MKIKDDFKLLLDKEDLEDLLVAIAKRIEEKVDKGMEISALDIMEIFDWELSSQKWDAKLENEEHKCIQIDLE